MCGSSSNYMTYGEGGKSCKAIKKKPCYSVSDDGRHTTFYASRSKSCIGSTPWCVNNCYFKTIPPPPLFLSEIENSTYNLSMFKDKTFVCSKIRDSKYVTFFASGTLEVFNVSIDFAINELCRVYDNKIVRFFIRKPLLNPMHPKNAFVVFSIDGDTRFNRIDYSLTSEHVNAISIVDHEYNKRLISVIKKSKNIKKIIRCKKCCGDKYLCFDFFTKNEESKFLLLMDYNQGVKFDA